MGLALSDKQGAADYEIQRFLRIASFKLNLGYGGTRFDR